jgi:hypothetical protein
MSATFKITINSIRTTEVDGNKVVKQVSFDVQGSQEGQQFSLPQTVELSDPDSAAFKPLSEVTESDVIAWVEVNFLQMDSVKAHIQHVLYKQITEASLKVTHLPWLPEPVVPAPEPSN